MSPGSTMTVVLATLAVALLLSDTTGCTHEPPTQNRPIALPAASPFDGARAGAERTIAGVVLCWCPAGRFTMGSPHGEPEAGRARIRSTSR